MPSVLTFLIKVNKKNITGFSYGRLKKDAKETRTRNRRSMNE